jgi:predicted metal-dependent peptidase
MSRKKVQENDIALKNYIEGYNFIKNHPMFAPLLYHVHDIRQQGNLCPEDGWAVITSNGYLHVHPKRRGEPMEWAYVIAHCLLHLGLDHFKKQLDPIKWNIACDCYIAKFLQDLKLGKPPVDMKHIAEFTAQSEEKLYETFMKRGVTTEYLSYGTASNNRDMLIIEESKFSYYGSKVDYTACFAQGLSAAVTSAVNVASGYEEYLGADSGKVTLAQKARKWFIDSYPLLGSIAANFKLIEDPIICTRMEISVAAINCQLCEIYINPAAGLDEYECRFVMAHEFMHAGLMHEARCQGRDPYLWNVACDYVINGWLTDMGLGQMPGVGGLYDPQLKGLSAESVYDRIVTDMRTFRKLATLRGIGLGDMLKGYTGEWWSSGDGIDLDDFYRRSLGQGLVYHMDEGRGYLPEGLIEEIRALSQPPISWDVELAMWFDEYFSPLEKTRSYARPSRRQSSTPDIPRPSWINAAGAEDGRTFGVILDTSGSMDRTLLAKALGAIASYSISRDVYAVRVIFCDAAAYDQGYMRPEDIAESVKVKGRGGTVLQPAIDLLDGAEDFPKEAPLLIITDGYCDHVRITRREHAYLLPRGHSLPFIPKGKVFRMS